MHAWNVSPKEAVKIQHALQDHVKLKDDFGEIKTIAGVDVGFEKNNTITRAAIAVLDFQTLEMVETAIARHPTTFPYVPGLLSFREIPAVLEAMLKLDAMPDLLLCDGQGIAHPRRFGIATHLGLLVDIPAIGVAKSRLTGTHDEVPLEKGSHVPLMDKGEQIGVVLRTRTNVKPLYISPGHRVSIKSSHELVMKCVTRYRLPETTRRAHKLASAV
ncbi:deoxyribonuclease V [Pontiella sulfatireligans]|uniref:Endonuclease V n=1 Tax=Pontiella sulfatireligans TaxID=2750658 RepID=A0A6C2UMX5_9BACT|nr:deoxyribonuclease V [Pontiella sulfatireligans]VGO21379.1 Endonuclease V [Pontiella sulfatireligans]